MMSRTPWSVMPDCFAPVRWIPAMTFTFQFERPGTYAVFCSIHPQMKATIIVE